MTDSRSAWADKEDEELQRLHNIECRKLVRSFNPTELGNLLYDILNHFELQRDTTAMTKYGFSLIEKFIERIKND